MWRNFILWWPVDVKRIPGNSISMITALNTDLEEGKVLWWPVNVKLIPGNSIRVNITHSIKHGYGCGTASCYGVQLPSKEYQATV